MSDGARNRRIRVPGWLATTLMALLGYFFGASLSGHYCYWRATRTGSELVARMQIYSPELAPYYWASSAAAGIWLLASLRFLRGRRTPRALVLGFVPVAIFLFGIWHGLSSAAACFG